MSASPAGEIVGEPSWHDDNQSWIVAELGALRARLSDNGKENGAGGDRTAPTRIARAMSSPPALEQLAMMFELSAFEQDVLLMAAGVELDAGFARAVAEAQHDARCSFPTFGLALSILAEPHWSALAPARPLRRWRLLELAEGGSLTSRPLQIDERVLHHLVGVEYVDHRLAGAIEHGHPQHILADSQRSVAKRIASAWRLAARRGDPLLVAHLRGRDVGAKQAVAAQACAESGLELLVLTQPLALEDPLFGTLVVRETRLRRAGLLVLADDIAPSASVTRCLERIEAVFISTRDRPWPMRRSFMTLDVEKPLPMEQRTLWSDALDDAEDAIELVVSRFDLGADAIRTAAAAAAADVAGGICGLQDAMWESCRRLSRPLLDDLAQRITPDATWADLVVPGALRETLELVATHVARRASVHEAWPFTKSGTRGLGITVLFSGPSGTGKTLAAEVLANTLRLDLYRVDLSQVVSKYIGETEKNLRRVFDAAEDGSAVLLFDEADALFGKRSEVKDSHDRYANIEVSYLLQRMEAYRGLAILTTNLKNAIDPAFLRRIQFVARFPFPTLEQRLAIWSRFFPEGSNVEGLDRLKLAQMNLSGGNIYNVARNAAFLAVDAGTPVRMEHVQRAAKDEFAKLERSSNLPRGS